MKRTPNFHRRGFTMIEILMTLGLLAFVFAAGGQLYRATILAGARSEQISNQASRLDSAIESLRADVWQCSAINVTDSSTAELAVNNHTITWRIEPNDSIERTDSTNSQMRWNSIGKGMSFAQEKATLVMIHKRGSANQRLWLYSQVLLANSQ